MTSTTSQHSKYNFFQTSCSSIQFPKPDDEKYCQKKILTIIQKQRKTQTPYTISKNKFSRLWDQIYLFLIIIFQSLKIMVF